MKGYGDKAKRKLGFIADEVDPIFMDEQGKTIDQVSVNGILIGAIQEQQKEFALRLRSVTDLQNTTTSEISKQKAEGEQTFVRLRELQSENTKLREEITTLRQSVDERLRAIERTTMARK